MKRIPRVIAWMAAAVLLLSGCNILENRPGVTRDWRLVEKSAAGTTVTLYAWGGDERANKWFDETLKPYLAETYQVKLNRVAMNYDEIFELLAADAEAKRTSGDIDLLWIGGRNFEYARSQKYLFGPFATKLPNVTLYINPKDPEFLSDRGVPLDGLAVPLGHRQLALFYNEDMIYDPPTDLASLMEAVKTNSGKFTYPQPDDPAGMAFIESVIYDKVGYKTLMALPPGKAAVEPAIQPAMDYLKALKPYLWMSGAQYPASEAELDKLFTDGTLAMAMSMDHNHATRLIAEDKYNAAAKPFFLKNGTVGNTHYLSIPWNAANKSGAMVTINAALDLKMQASKFRPSEWGDIPVLNMSSLAAEDLRTLKKSVAKKTSPKLDDLLNHRKPQMSIALESVIRQIWIEQLTQ